jgi:hypothetical protein
MTSGLPQTEKLRPTESSEISIWNLRWCVSLSKMCYLWCVIYGIMSGPYVDVDIAGYKILQCLVAGYCEAFMNEAGVNYI